MKKNKSLNLLLILLVIAIEIVSVSALSFAAGDIQGGSQIASANAKIEGSSKSKNSDNQTEAYTEAEAIKQYGKFKGKNAKRIPIITYHMVVTDKQKRRTYNGSSLAISKSSFNRQMKWLHDKGYRTINCEEFYLWYKGKIKLPKKTVLITFDDGHVGVADNALPVLKKYGMKGTVFIIGKRTKGNRKNSISYKRMLSIQKSYPDLEFQSHTYNLHNRYKTKSSYSKVLKDANKQKKEFDFDYIAYPYGTYTKRMIKAYKKSGIKLAFTYGTNNYATRKQNIYKIERIKIYGSGTMSRFKSWFK